MGLTACGRVALGARDPHSQPVRGPLPPSSLRPSHVAAAWLVPAGRAVWCTGSGPEDPVQLTSLPFAGAAEAR